MATKDENILRAVLDVRDVPFTAYTLPGEQSKSREWKHNSKERRTLANQLASYADADGTHIEVSTDTMARDTGMSIRAIKYLLDDLTTALGFLVDDGFAFHHGKRVRRRTLMVGRILEAAKVQNSSTESAKLDASKVQNSESKVQNSEVESAKLGGESAKLPIESANLLLHSSVDFPNLSANLSAQGEEERKKLKPKAAWADVMAHLPETMREGSWFAPKGEPRPEAGVRELIAEYGPLAVCGAVRQWWPGDTRWYWKDFVNWAPAYLANGGAAKYEKAENDRRYEESPEGIAAKAAAQEKLDEQTFREMEFKEIPDKPNDDPLAGVCPF